METVIESTKLILVRSLEKAALREILEYLLDHPEKRTFLNKLDRMGDLDDEISLSRAEREYLQKEVKGFLDSELCPQGTPDSDSRRKIVRDFLYRV